MSTNLPSFTSHVPESPAKEHVPFENKSNFIGVVVSYHVPTNLSLSAVNELHPLNPTVTSRDTIPMITSCFLIGFYPYY
jgi:hypothetical protein